MPSCECGECEAEQTFVCASCGKTYWYCHGADDKYFEDCNWCANMKFDAEEPVDSRLPGEDRWFEVFVLPQAASTIYYHPKG